MKNTNLFKMIYKKTNLVFKWFDPIIDLRKLFFSIPNYLLFFIDLMNFIKINNGHSIKIQNIYPCIHDKKLFTDFDRHYIYHPAWAARILSKKKPNIHVDISSSLHFCSIVSAFIPTKFYDFRPANIFLSNLSSEHADITNLPFESNCIQSLSCMHTVEHIGLGRYGDHLDPDGDIKAINELKRVLSPMGDLLFVVPVGKQKLMYNAHRVYSYDKILNYFNDFILKDFSLVPDNKELGLINNATKEMADEQSYGCGCFWFNKCSLP